MAEATVRLRVKGIPEHTAAAATGRSTRSTTRSARRWRSSTPTCKEMRSLDYKVRILDESKGTAAKTRVLITSGDGDETWGTVGVADNIIEASWQALVDSVEYKLRRDERRGRADRPVRNCSAPSQHRSRTIWIESDLGGQIPTRSEPLAIP